MITECDYCGSKNLSPLSAFPDKYKCNDCSKVSVEKKPTPEGRCIICGITISKARKGLNTKTCSQNCAGILAHQNGIWGTWK